LPPSGVSLGASIALLSGLYQCHAGGLPANPKDYLHVRLDDPSLPKPLIAALFPSDNGDRARLVWNRRRGE
jgi:hypothetical protein